MNLSTICIQFVDTLYTNDASLSSTHEIWLTSPWDPYGKSRTMRPLFA